MILYYTCHSIVKYMNNFKYCICKSDVHYVIVQSNIVLWDFIEIVWHKLLEIVYVKLTYHKNVILNPSSCVLYIVYQKFNANEGYESLFVKKKHFYVCNTFNNNNNNRCNNDNKLIV